MKDYSIYKFFKGEKESPFDSESIANHFWLYESVFDSDFEKRDCSDWHTFFSDYGLSGDFMKILSPNDYNKPTNKNGIFKLWLEYIFNNKLPQGEETLYNTTTVK